MLSILVTAALAQATLYRWFTFYETATPDFEAQYAILADDVHIAGPMAVSSLAEYKAALEEPYFVFGQNAHHVESVTFRSLAPGAATLAVAVTYQGIDKDGVTQAAQLAYEITMAEDPDGRLKIKTMTIVPIGPADAVFVPAYETNVARAEAFEDEAADATAEAR